MYDNVNDNVNIKLIINEIVYMTMSIMTSLFKDNSDGMNGDVGDDAMDDGVTQKRLK